VLVRYPGYQKTAAYHRTLPSAYVVSRAVYERFGEVPNTG
jgi:hypothetical protein